MNLPDAEDYSFQRAEDLVVGADLMRSESFGLPMRRRWTYFHDFPPGCYQVTLEVRDLAGNEAIDVNLKAGETTRRFLVEHPRNSPMAILERRVYASQGRLGRLGRGAGRYGLLWSDVAHSHADVSPAANAYADTHPTPDTYANARPTPVPSDASSTTSFDG